MDTTQPSNKRHSAVNAKKGRRRSQERQAMRRPAANVRNDFLKNKIWPISTSFSSVFQNKDKVEKEFFNSFSYICQLYNLKLKDVSQYPYPYNMSLSFKHLQSRLAEMNIGLQVVLENCMVCLATYKEVEQSDKQRFFPFAPILKYMKEPGRKHASELLLSVCTYLRHIVEVPVFGTGEHTSVDAAIDFIEEDMNNGCYDDLDGGMTYYQELENYLQSAYYHLRVMEKKLNRSIHLRDFEMRLNRLRPRDKEEKLLYQLASKAYYLYKFKPEITFEENYPKCLKDPHIEHRIDRSYKLCFYYSRHDHIDSELENHIDIFFSEDEERVHDVPIVYQVFDKYYDKEELNPEYVKSLLEVLYDLYDLLKLLDDKYHKAV
ncbi:hypothetical protein [Chitinophaga rhizophila]|uniref:Uncharacterized protein n=1 Tax=Chitinophaga rhizophila TaxID=2866212 RepID=A0ABS7G874_9BACT|nr:hypothetical protein [Chitinophaga rhizophila]MBW8683505.1 hypothetical protein [Chitinophaga rhizophila]